MNFINLLSILKDQIDHDTFTRLHDDFISDYQANYKALRPCKSTMEKAIRRYTSKATLKDEKTATYTAGGATVLLLDTPRQDAEPENLRTADLSTKIIESWKGRRPTDSYFFDDIALYKTLNKQEKQNYFLKLDGHLYNASLVAEMVECIADNKDRYIQAEICNNGALLIRQKYAAMILPVNITACNPSQNINMQDFIKLIRSIENEYKNDSIKAA